MLLTPFKLSVNIKPLASREIPFILYSETVGRSDTAHILLLLTLDRMTIYGRQQRAVQIEHFDQNGFDFGNPSSENISAPSPCMKYTPYRGSCNIKITPYSSSTKFLLNSSCLPQRKGGAALSVSETIHDLMLIPFPWSHVSP